ncbi:hypothetical protein GQ600_19359 [Phytophthora cactorum]|nr:hypothetical protein GQ600_19359 [Phytophthora cactorum]
MFFGDVKHQAPSVSLSFQKRHGADSSDSDQGESVMAPPFETWHDTLDALVARLDECQVQTSQLFHIRPAVNATARNQVRKKEEVAGSRADP